MTAPTVSIWEIGGRPLRSRLLLGTARYPSLAILQQAIAASGAEIVTVSLRRESAAERAGTRFWSAIKEMGDTGLAEYRRLQDGEGSRDHRRDGARNLRDAVAEAGSDRRRLHFATASVPAGRGGGGALPAGLPGFSVHHRGSGGSRAAGAGRLLDLDAVGSADWFGPGDLVEDYPLFSISHSL